VTANLQEIVTRSLPDCQWNPLARLAPAISVERQ